MWHQGAAEILKALKEAKASGYREGLEVTAAEAINANRSHPAILV